MKVIFLLVLIWLPASALADPDMDACLKSWRKHPFGNNPPFRKLKSSVKVLGIGGSVDDKESTAKPALILVKHSVSVMSKQTYNLMNPNGWYCLKGPVTVLGKSEINAHCKCHLAYSDEGVAVAASNEETGGVAVLGKIKVNRSCEPRVMEK